MEALERKLEAISDKLGSIEGRLTAIEDKLPQNKSSGLTGPSEVSLVLDNRPHKTAATELETIEEPITPLRIPELRKDSAGRRHGLFSLKKPNVDSTVSGEVTNFTLDFASLNHHITPSENFQQITHSVLEIAENLIDSKPKLVGSVSEHLNVGEPYEFDFYWHISGEYHCNLHEGHATISDGDDHLVEPTSVQQHLQRQLEESLTQVQLPPAFHFFHSDPKKSFNVHRKGFKVGLVYARNQQEVGVLIDLIPCLNILQLPKLKQVQCFMEEYCTGDENKWFDANKIEFAAVFNHESNWKVSVSQLEKDILNRVPDESKVAYRVVKYLLQSCCVEDDDLQFLCDGDDRQVMRSKSLYGLKTVVPSYYLKNEFIKLVLKRNNVSRDLVTEHLLKQLKQICPASQQPVNSNHFILESKLVESINTEHDRQKIEQALKEIHLHLQSDSPFTADKYPLLNIHPLRL